jgi:hypothetical protein
MTLILLGEREGASVGTGGAPQGVRGGETDKGATHILCDKVSELSLVTNYDPLNH